MTSVGVPLQAVQVEALVVMRIIKHSAQSFPSSATGSLVGMDQQGVLEITNAFPFPVMEAESAPDASAACQTAVSAAPQKETAAAYEREMIGMLREVNVDANNAGWYTSTSMGNFVSQAMIENQYRYQSQPGERAVALVHDVSRSRRGPLSLRAFRLSPLFMRAFEDRKFSISEYVVPVVSAVAATTGANARLTRTRLQKSKLRPCDIFRELPVQVHSSHLLTAYLHQLPSPLPEGEVTLPHSLAEIESGPLVAAWPLMPRLDGLTLDADPALERSCDLLLDSVEAHSATTTNFQYYHRALAREQGKIAAWQARRRAENASRAELGQEPLPEDEWKSLFKLPTEPSRLEAMTITRQAEQYAKQIDGLAAATTGKLFAIRSNLDPTDSQP
ncbi:hypothetical protein KEM52_001540 [Ascosphaera acerosa]|nr:hypothetical protein KEM52_001540 [Ascosphaera acerosa]